MAGPAFSTRSARRWPRTAVSLLVALSLALSVHGVAAAAEPAPAVTPTAIDRLHMDASFTLFAPLGAYAQRAPVAGGLAIRGLVAFPDLPLAAGLGAHVLAAEGRRFSEGTGAVYADDRWTIGSLQSSLETDLRMFDVFVHVEPHWERVRPFVEGSVGIAQYFTTWTRSLGGQTVAAAERADDATWTTALGVGLNIEPWRRRSWYGAGATWVVTLGVRRMHGGHITYVGPAARDESDQPRTDRLAPSLDAIVPFVGFGFVVVSAAPAPD